jgi:hypothetical protein
MVHLSSRGLDVQVGVFVGGGSECKLYGGEVRVRWETEGFMWKLSH